MANQDAKYVAFNGDGEYLEFGDGSDPQWTKAKENEDFELILPEECLITPEQFEQVNELERLGFLSHETEDGEIVEIEFMEWGGHVEVWPDGGQKVVMKFAEWQDYAKDRPSESSPVASI